MDLLQVRDQTPGAALYIYSVDSPFVNLMNQYMSTSLAIMPPRSEGELISLFSNHSLWINNQSVSPNSLTPIIPVNVTFLDRTD